MNTWQAMRLRPLLATIALLVLTSYTPVMADEFGFGGQGTWPSMSVNLSVQNGVIVAQGVTMGGSGNRVLWQTPLMRLSGSPGMAVQHGASTTFVQAGNRRIVIDNATGRAYVLANNQAWRRFPAGEPVDITGLSRPVPPSTTATPATPPPHYGSVSETPRMRETTAVSDTPPPAASGADTSRTLLTGGDNELKSISTYQQALRALMDANNRLLVRLERQQRLQRMSAPQGDIESASTDVEQAHREVTAAQKRVDSFLTLASAEPIRARTVEDVEGAPTPIKQAQMTPQQYVDLQQAEQRVLDLSAQMNRKALRIQEQKELGELTAAQLEREQRTIEAYQREVDRANLHLQELRLAANRPEELPAQVQAQVGQSEREIVSLNDKATQLERQLRDVEARQLDGKASEQDVQDVQAQVTATYKQLSSASRELTDLHNAFFHAQVIEPIRARESATAEPAEKSAWPRANTATQPSEPSTPKPGPAERNVVPETKDLNGLQPRTGLD